MKRNSQFSAGEVAAWMLAEFNRNGVLFHDVAVTGIRQNFDVEFTHLTHEEAYVIDQDVLREFSALTNGKAVWNRKRYYWRLRTANDGPGGQVND